MKILVACDSFKGSLSAAKAVEAIEKGIKEVNKDIEVIKLPVADGGEGTVDAFLNALKGEKIYVKVHDPFMREIDAYYGVINNTAVIEMEAASGLMLVNDHKNPLKATSFGTGELIKDALDKGFKKIVIGIGGSATNDGGAGMAQALGVKFFNKNNVLMSNGIAGGDLINIKAIDISEVRKEISQTEIIIASDVSNTLLGKSGATYVFGPQKGADENMLKLLEDGMSNYANLIGPEIKDISGSGAAGGLGAGLLYFLKGSIVSGIDFLLNSINYEELLKDVDLVITGEGKIDGQSLKGKVPIGIARRTKNVKDIPVIALVGTVGEEAYKTYNEGIDAIFSIAPGPIKLEDAMANAGEYLKDTSTSIVRLIQALDI